MSSFPQPCDRYKTHILSKYNSTHRALTHLPLGAHIYVSESALVQIMVWCWIGVKPLSKPIMGLLSIRPLGTNFSKILIKTSNFSFVKMHLKITSTKWQPFCPGGDELIRSILSLLFSAARCPVYNADMWPLLASTHPPTWDGPSRRSTSWFWQLLPQKRWGLDGMFWKHAIMG